MADLDLNDALHESTLNVEPEIKRDFIASLEAEKYDDVVGESVTKESYVPLLDDETKSPPSEAKENVMVHLHEETAPEQSDGGQLAERPGATEQESAELPNGEHGVGKTDGMEIHKRPLGIDPLSFGFDSYIEGATMETISPSAQMGTEPPFSTPGILERPDTKELFNLETVLLPEHEMKGATMSCPALQHLNSLVKVTEELSSEEKRTSECSLVSSEEMAHPQEQMLDSTWQATDSMATVTAPLAFEEDLWVNQEEVTNSSTTLSPAEQELSTELSGNLAEVNLWEKETLLTDSPTKPAQQHMESTQEVTEEFGVPFLSLHQAESSFHPVDRCDPDLSSTRLMDDRSPVSNIAKTTAAVDTVLQTPTKYSPTSPQQENLSCEARLPPSTEPFSPACGNFDSSVGAVDLTNNTTEIAVLPTKTVLLDRTPGKVKLAEATSEIAQNIESPVVKVAVEKKKKKKKRSHPKGAQPPAMDMHAKAKEVQAIVSDQRLEGPPRGTGEHKENVLNSEGSSKEASGLQVKTQVAGGVPSQSSVWASESSDSELAHQPLHHTKTPSESDVRAVVESQRSEAAHAANQSQMERMSEVEWTHNTLDCWSREVTASEFLQASKMEEKVEHPLELWGENIISPNSQKKTEVSRVAPLTPLELDGQEYTPPQSKEVPEMKVKEGPYLAHISKEPTSPGSKQMFEANEMTVREDSQITVFRSQLPFEVKEVADTLLESKSGGNHSPKFQQTFEVKEKTEPLTENADREPSLLESLKVPEGKQKESSPEHVAGLAPSHQSGEMSGVNKMAEAPLNLVDTEATSPESNKISEVKMMTPIPLNNESRETSSLGLKQTLEVKEMAETSLAQLSTETAPSDLDISEVKGVVAISLENCESKIAPVEEQKSEGEILVESTLCWNRETAPSELQQMPEVNEVVEKPLECWDREISPPDSQTFNVKELVASPPEGPNKETGSPQLQQTSEMKKVMEVSLEYPNKETGSPQLQQTSEMKEMLESPLEHPNKETDLSEAQQASEVNEMVKSPMEYQEGFPKCTDQVTSSSPKQGTLKLLDDTEEKGSKAVSKKEAGPKVLQKRGFPKGTLQRETGAKVSSDQQRATKTSMQPKVMKVPNQRQRDVKQLGSEKIGEINVQSDQEGHLDKHSRQDEDYNDLCKAKPVDCFTEKGPCMQPQKDWSRSEWEWHRAGEQHENELKVELSSAASPRAKDGLIKHVALTDEDKLGFFSTSEGGKEQKNAVSVTQSKEFCKSWSTSPTNLSASGQYVGEMNPVTGEWSQPTVGRQVNVGSYEIGKEDLTKKRTDKNGELMSCSANSILLNPSAALGNPAQNIKNDKISVWNPNFMPDNKVDSDCKQMVDFKDSDKSTLCETDLHSNSIPPYTLTIQKSDTPIMVDYEQDPSDTGNLAHTEDVKVDLVTDSITSRGANQRKMMRRAMSECSHLSVPSSLSISEKYPDPSPGDSLSQSANSSGSQVPAAGNRKYPKSQIKRSMTVAEEQIPVNSFDADQTAAELQLTDEGHNKESSNAPSDTSDMKGGANTAFNHGRLGKIPEISSTKIPEEKLHGKNEQTGVFTDLQRNDFSGGSVRPLRKETIEVNNVQTSPFSQLQEKPHDSVLLNSAFIETICNSSGLPQNIEMTHYELEQAAEQPQGLAQLNLQHEARFRKSDASSSSVQQPSSVPKAPYSHIESSKTGGGKCSEQSKTADQKGKEPNSTKSCDPVTVTNRELASAQAKPEESSEGMVGTESAVTSKERPLSTDAKGKTGTPAAKTSPTKSKPQPPASLKRPPATTTSPNKKLVTSTSATTAATTSKRVPSNLVRPSSATTKEMKPKATEAKSPVKLPSTRPSSASVTKTASNTTVKSSTTSLQKMSTAPGSTQRNNMLSNPKRPTSIKTEPKSAEMRKSLSAKSPLGETGRPKTASSTSIKSTGTTPSTPSTPMGASTPATPSSNTSRPPRTLALKTTAASEAKRVAPIPRAPSKPTVATAPKQLRPTSAPAPDLKNVKSKIGSTDNIKHQPGGGKAKPVEKRPEPVRLSRKAESSTVTRVTKTTTMKDSQKQTNGKVQIVNKKIDYSHVQSKCGSKDNIKHVPGGGNVQIPKTKLDVSRASSKCGSKTNLKHKAGGGDVKIETAKTDFKNKAESKIGSLDNLNHIPGGGNVKNEGEEESESATISQIPENGDLTGQAESVTQQNGVGEDPTARSAETHSQELQIQETY